VRVVLRSGIIALLSPQRTVGWWVDGAPVGAHRAGNSRALPGVVTLGLSVNTDNRLTSDTAMSLEMQRLVEAFGYGWSDLERFPISAMKSAFIPLDERLAIIDEVIRPRFAVLIG
jgi:Adenosine deaminase